MPSLRFCRFSTRVLVLYSLIDLGFLLLVDFLVFSGLFSFLFSDFLPGLLWKSFVSEQITELFFLSVFDL